MLKETALAPSLTGFQEDVSHRRLKRTCAEFESIFITHLLRSMRKTIVKDGLFGNSHESKMFKSLFDERLAMEIARGGGIGLGKMILQQLQA